MSVLRWRRSLGSQARLVILILDRAPPGRASSVAMLRVVDGERTRIERDAMDRLETLLPAIDRQISSILTAVQIFSTSWNLPASEVEARVGQIRAPLLTMTRPSGRLPSSTATVFDRNGFTVARNRAHDPFLGRSAPPVVEGKMPGAIESWFPDVTNDGLAIYSGRRPIPPGPW